MLVDDLIYVAILVRYNSAIVISAVVTWQKPTKLTMKFSGKFSVSCSSYTYDAYVVCHSSIEGKFSNFSRFTHTPIQLG